ncbi:MAG: SAM-dependent methyltransferase [Gemmatimonadetes bacterium]|nr:SAM-dependent methyltransferase [Gemmatimonadota bacterium]
MTSKSSENQTSGVVRFLIKLFQVVLYIPIQVAFIPLAIVGLIDAIYKEMVVSKRLGVSFTAIKALQYRWFLHYFETRPDPFSVAFTKKLPCESHFGLWSTFGALIIAQRLFGLTTAFGRLDEPGKETLSSTPTRRVIVFDEIMERYVDDIEQIVILGAGFDLIALHFTRGKNARVFELDQPGTLNVKVATLESAGIAHDWITYIPVDYSRESWANKLLEAGFDRTRRTLFLWQSVSLYLEPDVVKTTLRDMADLSADGSIIAQDFYSEAFVSGKTSRAVRRSVKVIERMGEHWRFGIDMSNDPEAATRSFLEDCGLRMTDYFQFGSKLDLEPFYCIVEAERLEEA